MWSFRRTAGSQFRECGERSKTSGLTQAAVARSTKTEDYTQVCRVKGLSFQRGCKSLLAELIVGGKSGSIPVTKATQAKVQIWDMPGDRK